MTLQEIFDGIERPSFSAHIGVVSTPRRFEEAIAGEDVVGDLLTHMQTPGGREDVRVRFLELLNADHDPAYAHPFDLPLATYLWAFRQEEPDTAAELARHALAFESLWWTRAMSLEALKEAPRTKTSCEVFAPGAEGVARLDANSFATLAAFHLFDLSHGGGLRWWHEEVATALESSNWITGSFLVDTANDVTEAAA